MRRKRIFIPHLKKTAVKDLRPGADPSNPPLMVGEDKKAELLLDAIVSEHGEPSAIFYGLRERCFGTAKPAIERFGQHGRGGVLVMGLNTLAQTDSGEEDPTSPKARADGLVIYGDESTCSQWHDWFKKSRAVILAVEEHVLDPEQRGPILVFTTRPITAAARWDAEHRDATPGLQEIDDMDKSLFPFCVFEEQQMRGYMLMNWKEIPRT